MQQSFQRNGEFTGITLSRSHRCCASWYGVNGEKGHEYRETVYGRIERAVTLPHGVKAEKITARYENGVLELAVPLPVELAGKKIPIQIEAGKKTEPKAA